MGLKLLDLALCSVRGRQVIINTTKETATVEAVHEGRKLTFFLRFADGRRQEIRWSLDLQGYNVTSVDLEEVGEAA